MTWTNDYESLEDFMVFCTDRYKDVMLQALKNLRECLHRPNLQVDDVVVIRVEDDYCLAYCYDDWRPISIIPTVIPFTQTEVLDPREIVVIVKYK